MNSKIVDEEAQHVADGAERMSGAGADQATKRRIKEKKNNAEAATHRLPRRAVQITML